MKSLDEKAVVALPAGTLDVRLDVTLDDGGDVAGRAILWDGPDFAPGDAPVMACAFAIALQQLYPNKTITTIGVWQARRQRLVEVPYAQAVAATAAASAILAVM